MQCKTCNDSGQVQGGNGPLGEIEWLNCPHCEGPAEPTFSGGQVEIDFNLSEPIDFSAPLFGQAPNPLGDTRPIVDLSKPGQIVFTANLPKKFRGVFSGKQFQAKKKKGWKQFIKHIFKALAIIYPGKYRHGRQLQPLGQTKSCVWGPKMLTGFNWWAHSMEE